METANKLINFMLYIPAMSDSLNFINSIGQPIQVMICADTSDDNQYVL